MTDNLKKRRPQDASRINIHEPWEVRWWCCELQIGRARLEAAVREVGTSAAAVKRHLQKMKR
jgi:uncharacterized protein DUF3606